MSNKGLKETIGLVGVIAGLLFVGWEIRQNNQLARAAAYQAMGAELAEFWLTADPILSKRFSTVPLTAEDISAMSEEELARAWANWVSVLRTLEATWRQVELGLLDPEAFGYFGNNSPVFTGAAANNLQLIWPEVRDLMSPDFAAFVEASWEVSD